MGNILMLNKYSIFFVFFIFYEAVCLSSYCVDSWLKSWLNASRIACPSLSWVS